MSKEFTEVAFNLEELAKELARFRDFLNSKSILGEREINEGLDADDIRRLRWRTHHVIVNSHTVVCMTYDDLYKELNDGYQRYSAAFKVETTPSQFTSPPASTQTDASESKGAS